MKQAILTSVIYCASAMGIITPAHAQDCVPKAGEQMEIRLAPASREAGYTLEFDPISPRDAVSLRFVGTGEPLRPAAAVAIVDATPYRGRSITLSACVITSGDPTPLSGLWLRVDRPEGGGFFDNMADRPFQETNWSLVEVTGPVADDATQLALGVSRYGVGSITVRGLTLTVNE